VSGALSEVPEPMDKAPTTGGVATLDTPSSEVETGDLTRPMPDRHLRRPVRRGWRLRPWRRGGGAPYALLVPAAVVLIGVLGYPLYLVIKFSFEKYGLFQLISRKTSWDGLANYTYIFKDAFFWHVLLRTVIFTVANVGLTLIVGLLVALGMARVGKVLRTAVGAGMVCAWVMPSVTSPIVFQWLFQPQFGVANWVLTKLGIGHFTNTNWFAKSPLMAFSIITIMIVWQAIPFVAITLSAGLTQVPEELYEAARLDGARGWAVFRHVTFPMIKPIVILLGILSTIWDFTVFNQIWVMVQGTPVQQGTETLGIWTYVESFSDNQYGRGSAIAVVSVLLVGLLTAWYVRKLVRAGEV
jgi:N,N'-diacetylchitobiose transport system permease protein